MESHFVIKASAFSMFSTIIDWENEWAGEGGIWGIENEDVEIEEEVLKEKRLAEPLLAIFGLSFLRISRTPISLSSDKCTDKTQKTLKLSIESCM